MKSAPLVVFTAHLPRTDLPVSEYLQATEEIQVQMSPVCVALCVPSQALDVQRHSDYACLFAAVRVVGNYYLSHVICCIRVLVSGQIRWQSVLKMFPPTIGAFLLKFGFVHPSQIQHDLHVCILQGTVQAMSEMGKTTVFVHTCWQPLCALNGQLKSKSLATPEWRFMKSNDNPTLNGQFKSRSLATQEWRFMKSNDNQMSLVHEWLVAHQFGPILIGFIAVEGCFSEFLVARSAVLS